MNQEKILLAIASLVISVLLWLQVQPINEPGREREFPVRLTFEGLPEDLTVTGIPESVIVIATGSVRQLDAIKQDEVTAVVDLSHVEIGETYVPITVPKSPIGDVIISAKMPTIPVTVERVVTAEAPVTIQQVGTIRSDLVYQTATINPTRVLLSGPKTNMERVAHARVSLNMASVSPGATYTLDVEVLDEKEIPIPGIKIEPSQVEVSPAVSPADQSKVVPVSVDWIGSLPRGYDLVGFTLEPNSVRLTGSSQVLNSIFEVRTAPLKLTNLKGSKTVDLKISVPEGAQPSSQTVKLSLKIARRD